VIVGVIVAIFLSMAVAVAAQSLTARLDGDRLRIAAPRLHFLVGEALTRLRDGVTVRYEFLLTVRNDRNGRPVGRAEERFAVSYDLWEEKFAVTKLGASPRTVSHLSAAAAEAWCIENVSITGMSLAANRPVWIRVDYRAAELNAASDPQDNSGFTLSGLVDIFSRRQRSEPLHGSEEVGPLNLDSLKKK
jgi:hypothetical protein